MDTPSTDYFIFKSSGWFFYKNLYSHLYHFYHLYLIIIDCLGYLNLITLYRVFLLISKKAGKNICNIYTFLLLLYCLGIHENRTPKAKVQEYVYFKMLGIYFSKIDRSA